MRFSIAGDPSLRKAVYGWARQRRRRLYTAAPYTAAPIPLGEMERLITSQPLTIEHVLDRLERLTARQEAAARGARTRSRLAIAAGSQGRHVAAFVLRRLDPVAVSLDILDIVEGAGDATRESQQRAVAAAYRLLGSTYQHLLVGAADALLQAVSRWDELDKLAQCGLGSSSQQLRELARLAYQAEAEILGKV